MHIASIPEKRRQNRLDFALVHHSRFQHSKDRRRHQGLGIHARYRQECRHFIAALKDTSIKAILANRGGYGTIQLVDLIDPKLVKKNPKWLIGYSDITTLHAMQTKAGVMSIHGTMSSSIAKTAGKDDNSTLLRDLLKGEVPTYKVPKHKYNQKGKAEGILVGGNMTTFVPLATSTFSRTTESSCSWKKSARTCVTSTVCSIPSSCTVSWKMYAA